jgi:UDP:flavonoid glycosyltransferase YjiC (YdhE family)
MRIMFIPWAQKSHYPHMVPLVWAFRAAGHEVRIATQPMIAEMVAQSGSVYSEIGAGYDFEPETARRDREVRATQWERFVRLSARLSETGAMPGPAAGTTQVASVPRTEASTHPRTEASMHPGPGGAAPDRRAKIDIDDALGPLLRAAEVMADDLVRLVRAWRPDLIIADPHVLAAPIAAETAGAPLLHQLAGPWVQRRTGIYPGIGLPVELWPRRLRELFDRFGVAPVEEATAGAIDPCPDRLQYPGIPARIPIRFVPYNGPGEVPDWLAEPPERPRVCVTWGMLSYDTLGADGFLVPQILEALGGLGVETVVTVGARERALLGDPPPHTRYVTNLPLHLLLPTCTAIVHQGGTGTLLTAASYGVPQTAVAVLPGHLIAARQFAGTGAGIMVDSAEATVDTLRDAVIRTLAEPTRDAAGRLREEMAAYPSPAEVVGTLVGLVEAHRSGVTI